LNKDKTAKDVSGSAEELTVDKDTDMLLADDQVGEETVSTEGEAQDEAEAEAEVELSVEEQLAQAEARAADYLDGWQRARAEFANARKRLERQRTEAYANAGVDFVTRLLPIVDDLKRALDSAPPAIMEDPWFEGLDLVNRKFQSMMESMNVRAIEAVGQPFDPTLHEALALREAEGVESGIVIEELQTGYQLGDRVIRPSLVNVSA
jgi:molecular chaperone GrpE